MTSVPCLCETHFLDKIVCENTNNSRTQSLCSHCCVSKLTFLFESHLDFIWIRDCWKDEWKWGSGGDWWLIFGLTQWKRTPSALSLSGRFVLRLVLLHSKKYILTLPQGNILRQKKAIRHFWGGGFHFMRNTRTWFPVISPHRRVRSVCGRMRLSVGSCLLAFVLACNVAAGKTFF